MVHIANFLGFLLYVSWVPATIGAKSSTLMGRSIPRHDFAQVQSSDGDESHELIFAIKQRNLVQLDAILIARSTPGSPFYQQWMSFDEVGQLTSNPDGAKAVEDWLAENNIPVTWKSAHSDYLKASAKISQWEQMLDTKFFLFEDHSKKNSETGLGRIMHRAEEYSLPEHVSEHLSTVFNTVQVPPVLKRSHPHSPADEGSSPFQQSGANLRGPHLAAAAAASGAVTVAFLNELYGMGGLEGNTSMAQAVFATDLNYFSSSDLAYFQGNNSLSAQTVEVPYGFSTESCENKMCDEGNLDTQFITGMAPGIQTVYWYVPGDVSSPDPFMTWAIEAANSTDAPLVTVIPYGAIEQVQFELFLVHFYFFETVIDVLVRLSSTGRSTEARPGCDEDV